MAERLNDSIRIRCLLLHCQPTLAGLLQYLLDQSIRDGLQTSKLPELLKQKRDVFQSFKHFTFIKYSSYEKVDLRKLDILELCEVLKSKKLGLLEPLRCCKDACEHECLTCPEKCQEKIGCYKKHCGNCGEDSHSCLEQVFLKSVSLVEELCIIQLTFKDQAIINFFEFNAPFSLLPNYKSWEHLWRGVQKSMANILNFLCEKGSITKDNWKDCDMEMRNVLKRRPNELEYLFGKKLKSLMRTRTGILDPDQEHEANRHRKQRNKSNDIQQSPTAAIVSINEPEDTSQNLLCSNEENSCVESFVSPASSVTRSNEDLSDPRSYQDPSSISASAARSYQDVLCHTTPAKSYKDPSSDRAPVASSYQSSPNAHSPKNTQQQRNTYMTLNSTGSERQPQTSSPNHNYNSERVGYYRSLQQTPTSNQPSPGLFNQSSQSMSQLGFTNGLGFGAYLNFIGSDHETREQQSDQKHPSRPVESESLFDNTEKPNFSMLSNLKSIPNVPIFSEQEYAKYHQEKYLVLIRGLPGSGRTELATKVTSGGGIILSTDDYFRDANGKYTFNCDKIEEAHKWNQERALEEMRKGTAPICIDNTNLVAWEMTPYVKNADKMGYKTDLLKTSTSWALKTEILAKRTTTGISKKKLDGMLRKYEQEVRISDIRKAKKPTR